MIEYLHVSPIRPARVAATEDGEWSSDRRHAGLRPVRVKIDPDVLETLQWGELRRRGGAEN